MAGVVVAENPERVLRLYLHPTQELAPFGRLQRPANCRASGPRLSPYMLHPSSKSYLNCGGFYKIGDATNAIGRGQISKPAVQVQTKVSIDCRIVSEVYAVG